MADRRALPVELIQHLAELSRRLGMLSEPVQARLAGGFAVHYYTQHRMSRDVDIMWSHRVAIPPDLRIFEVSESGSGSETHAVVMDGNFTDVLGSFPPDWEKRVRELHRFDNIVLCVIDAVDLAVSKVARFSDRDKEDIRALAHLGLVDMEVFASRADEAMSCYVGDLSFVRVNLSEAKEIIEKAGTPTLQPSPRRGSTKSDISDDGAFEPDDASQDDPFAAPNSDK